MSMPAPWASSSTGYHAEHWEAAACSRPGSPSARSMGVANADIPRKSLVRPCAGLARVFSRPARASVCTGLSGPAIAALPGPCSLSGSLDWLVCVKWQAACDFWHTGGMVILTTPYAERTAWGMINMIIPCPMCQRRAYRPSDGLFAGLTCVCPCQPKRSPHGPDMGRVWALHVLHPMEDMAREGM